MTKRRRWILLPLAALAAVLLVVVLLFDWNWFKGPLEGAVSAALERQFEMAGDLDVDLARAPTITLERVRIANAEWGSRPAMLTIRQARFAIDLWPLLKGEIQLPFLRVEEPDLLLETNRQGLANWKFGEQDQPEAPPVIPIIRDLEVVDATVRYHEPDRPQDLVATLETVEGAIASSGVQLSADGTLNAEPLSVRLASAALEQLEAETEAKRFPFEVDARLGSSRLAATGSAEQLLQAQGLSVEIVVDSQNPEMLLALAGREPRDLGNLDLAFSLTRQDQIWTLQQIDLRLGESDLTGDVSISSQGEEPALAADLHSNQVTLAAVRDVVALVTDGAGGASRDPALEAALADAREALQNQAQGDTPAEKSDLGLSPATLPAIDAAVSYTVDSLSGPELALRDIDFEGRLSDRLPHISLRGSGQYKGEPVTIDVQAGDPAKPGGGEAYPIHANLAAAGTRAEVEGALKRPADLAGLELRFEVASQDLDQLLALADVGAPPIPPFEVEGQLVQDGSTWQLTELDARLGESDIQGRVTIALGEPEPVITADLASSQVRLEDLRPLLPGNGAQASGTGPEAALDAAIAEAKAALAPDEQKTVGGFGLRPDMLPKVDAEVRYAADRLFGPDLALADLQLYARLEEGLPRLELTGGGQYQDAPVTVDVQLGRAEQTASGNGAYPVQAWIEAATTQAQIEGVIGQPETLDGLDLQVQVSSEDINQVLALVEVDLPQIPPFALSGHVVQDGEVWRIGEFYGQFSESELAGELAVDLSEQRPFITADLQSSRLLVSDLVTAGDRAAVVEDEVAAAAAEAEGDASAAEGDNEDTAGEVEDEEIGEDGEVALISIEGLNFEALPNLDADVSFEGEFVEVQEFRFAQLSFDLKLRDQVVVLDASGEGQFRDGPLSFEAHLGTKDSLEEPDARYPIDVQIASEETRVTAEGTAAEPGRLAGLEVDVALSGPDLDRLGEILQLSLPTTPPFDLQSHLARDDDRWILTDLNGVIGDSDVQGDVTIFLGDARPTLQAELTSDKLDFDDLGLLVGAPADPEETVSIEQERAAAEEAAVQGVLPDEPFDVPELRAMDARVSYRAKQVQAQKLPLEGMVLDLTLEDGQLTLEPLRFDLADGALDSVIRLDGRSDVLAGDLELSVRNIRLNRLLSHFDIEIAEIEMEQEGVGTFGGRADLAVRGNSIQELAGSADGKVAMIMRGGRINALIVEAVGLDVGEAIALLLSGEEKEQSEMVPIQCLVARFDVQDGVMQAKALVLETSDSTITGKGQINLGEETLSIELLAHPKDASALTASTPVRIEGTFENPEIDLISDELQEKSLAALALGVVLPVIGAIIPFFEEGETEDTNCARLIQAASAAMPTESSAEQSD